MTLQFDRAGIPVKAADFRRTAEKRRSQRFRSRAQAKLKKRSMNAA
jgi:hypothetical protein